MGLRDRLNNNKFKPKALTDSNVQAAFNRVLATDDTKRPIHLGLYNDDNSTDIRFDLDAFEKNYKTIQYIFGQVKAVHEQKRVMDITELVIKYDDTVWTTNKETLMKFMYLIISSRFITALKKGDSRVAVLSSAKMTLSPSDSNFETWYAEHKSEWEDVKTGQEHGDDK